MFRAFSPFSSTTLALPFSCLVHPQSGFPHGFKMVPAVTVVSFHTQHVRDSSFSLISLKAKKELFYKSLAVITWLSYCLKFSHMLILESITGWLILISPLLGSDSFNHKGCIRRGSIPQQNWDSVSKDEGENEFWHDNQWYPPLFIKLWKIALLFS